MCKKFDMKIENKKIAQKVIYKGYLLFSIRLIWGIKKKEKRK